MLQWHLWRCISYWKWWYSIAMSVCQRVVFGVVGVSCPIGLSWGLVVPWHIAGILFVGVTVAHKLLGSGDGNIRHRWLLFKSPASCGGGKHGKHPTQLALLWVYFAAGQPDFFPETMATPRDVVGIRPDFRPKLFAKNLRKGPRNLKAFYFFKLRTWRPVIPAKTLEDDCVFPLSQGQRC